MDHTTKLDLLFVMNLILTNILSVIYQNLFIKTTIKIPNSKILYDLLLQENVGGTTYFYQASTGADSHNSTGDNLSIGVSSNIGAAYQCYPGTPSHLQGIKASPRSSAGGSTNGSFFVSEDMRIEILQKNALTLMQPDHEQFPGLFILFINS